MTRSKAASTRLNARLDAELSEKLEYLKDRTKLSVTEVVKRSIERYYDEVRRGSADTHSLLMESGFIGCADGPADLSTEYKRELGALLRKKA
jgi:hypothetical protein